MLRQREQPQQQQRHPSPVECGADALKRFIPNSFSGWIDSHHRRDHRHHHIRGLHDGIKPEAEAKQNRRANGRPHLDPARGRLWIIHMLFLRTRGQQNIGQRPDHQRH